MNSKIVVLILILIVTFKVSGQNGVVKTYYPDKSVKSESMYINDILDGPSIEYYSDGKKKLERNYSKGIINGTVKEYYENGNVKEEFQVVFGVNDGNLKRYFEDGSLKEILVYEQGRIVSKKHFNDINALVQKETLPSITPVETPKLQEKVIELPKPDVFKPAELIGSINAIQQKIVYPEHALKYGLEGVVTLNVYIDETGKVIKGEIKRGIGLGCDEEALKVIKDARFIPAKKNGNPIASELNIDLQFKMPLLPKEEKVVAAKEIMPEKVQAEIKKSEPKKFEENLSVMCEADRCPRPEDDLSTIYSKLELPNIAIALKLKGNILFEVIVDKEGNLKSSKIIDGVGYGCDQLVEAVLLKSKFTPAKRKGEDVEAKAVINFPFNYEWKN